MVAEARHEALARLRALVEVPRVLPGRLSSALVDVDRWLGGFPSPGVTEVVGRPGSGRLAVVLPALGALTRRGRPVVLIDPLRQLHPPGLGCDLAQVVLVRPPPEQAGWVAEQVARSGAVEAALLLDAPRLGRGGVRLARACEAGSCAAFVVGEDVAADLPAALRLSADGWAEGGLRLSCTRSRDGRHVGVRVVAA